MPACSAYGCTNRPGKKMKGISFHRFPKHPTLRKAWVIACRRTNWSPSDVSVLCSEHFSEDQIDRTSFKTAHLKDKAVPNNFKCFPSYYQKISGHPLEKTGFNREASVCESKRTLTASLSCLEKEAAQSIFSNLNACERSVKETNIHEMKLGEEQNTSTPHENIPLEAMSDSNVLISERQENDRKLPGRPRKRKQGPSSSIHKKEKSFSGNSQANCDEITSSNGIASDQNISLSISSRKKGPFRSIYNEKKDSTTDSQTNCYEISSSSGNVTDLNVSSSFGSQLLPNVCIKKEKPWEEEYNYFANSCSYLSRDSNKMQIEINDVRSVPSTGSFSDGKMNANRGKVPGSLSGPLKIEPREEVFGKLVACEMSDLCVNPDLYLKTKQAILNLLVQARFDQMKQSGEIL